MRILLIEDDESIAGPISRTLKREYTLDHAASCRDARLLLALHSYDILIIDLGLPDGSGTDICVEHYQSKAEGKILILSGETSESAKIFHLETYVEDYVTKPFSLSELTVRVQNILKRDKPPSKTHVAHNESLYLDTKHKQAYFNQSLLPLRRKEFEILSVLHRYVGKPVIKSMVLEEIWDDLHEPFSNTIDAHICTIRKVLRKYSPDIQIQTVRGIGYQLILSNESTPPTPVYSK